MFHITNDLSLILIKCFQRFGGSKNSLLIYILNKHTISLLFSRKKIIRIQIEINLSVSSELKSLIAVDIKGLLYLPALQ